MNIITTTLLCLAMVITLESANIALNKPAYQTGQWEGLSADKAVDGNLDIRSSGNYYESVCAHPLAPTGVAKWWVDLEATYTISTVTIYNTYNSGGYFRMNHFDIEVVAEDNTRYSCGHYSSTDPVLQGGSYTVACNKQGRYVYVTKLPGYVDQRLIAICEVQVDGFLTTTAAPIPTTTGPVADILLLGKSTNQTGVFEGMTSDKAVDGRHLSDSGGESNCAHPDNIDREAAEWWVNLGHTYKITSITVYNTNNGGGYHRLTDFEFRVYSPGIETAVTCATYPGRVGSGAMVTLTCADDVYGQYVQFIRLGGTEIYRVAICEVEIKGALYPGCSTGYYGVDCDQTCDRCATDPDLYNPCDKSGICLKGCQMWWVTDTCNTHIVLPNYNSQYVTVTVKSNEAELRLEQIEITAGTSQYYGYKVSYGTESRNIAHNTTSQYITFTLTGLTYDTEYSIRIEPYRVMGTLYEYGTSYPIQTVRTQSKPTYGITDVSTRPTFTSVPTIDPTTPTTPLEYVPTTGQEIPSLDRCLKCLQQYQACGETSDVLLIIPWALFTASAAINLVVAGIMIYRCRNKSREASGKPHDEKINEQPPTNMASRHLTELKPDTGGYEFVDIRNEAEDHTARPDVDQQHNGEMETQIHRQPGVAPDNVAYEDLQYRIPVYENNSPYDIIP